jgi:predicted RNA-binding protein YlxR (DUF448 family)
VTATAAAITLASLATETPQRRCIVTGETGDRPALLRFVVGPDGAIVPDIDARLPGRGLWLLPRRDIVERAVAKRLFSRAARRPVEVPQGLADRIEALLARRCCDTLGLARRAGLAVAGFERVSEAVRRGDAALLLLALDGAEAGRRRLTALARGADSASVLDAAEQGAAFGHDRAVFVAVGSGPLSSRLLLDLGRLAGFRSAAVLTGGLKFAPARPEPEDGGTRTHE